MENNIHSLVSDKIKLTSKFNSFLENSWDLLKFAIVAIIIVVPIRMWIAQPFVVSGESMFPTFHNGEYLIVDEISYITGSAHRGDIVVFRFPGDTKRFFIKRVIGLPGEKVVIKNNQVIIINKEHPDGLTLNEPYVNNETFSMSNIVNKDGEYITKDNEYFVMGDNRNNSSDSRFWGMLPKNLMVGRAYLRLLPFNEISYLPGKYNQK